MRRIFILEVDEQNAGYLTKENLQVALDRSEIVRPVISVVGEVPSILGNRSAMPAVAATACKVCGCRSELSPLELENKIDNIAKRLGKDLCVLADRIGRLAMRHDGLHAHDIEPVVKRKRK